MQTVSAALQRKFLLAHTSPMPVGTELHLTLSLGTVPQPRMTQRGMWVKKPALAYRSWKQRMQDAIRQESQNWEMLVDQPFSLDCIFLLEERLWGVDTKNLLASIEDAAQGLLYQNDRFTQRISGQKQLAEKASTEIVVTVLGLRQRPGK